MRVLYDAENVLDAYLVRNVLEQAGLPCFIRGEHLSGAIGELPMQGLVQVCVPEPCWPEAQACLQQSGLVPVAGERAPAPVAADGMPDLDGPEWVPA